MADGFIEELAGRVPLNDRERAVLEAAGVGSYEDLHSLVQAFPSIAQIGVELAKLSNAAFTRIQDGFAARTPDAQTRLRLVSFGALPPAEAPVTRDAVVGLPSPARRVVAMGPAPAPIDLRLPNWPVRDQGQRGTCVSFGTTACAEHAVTSSGHPADLSEQFLYWAIKTATADPKPASDGTWLEFSKAALDQEGICLEQEWPYVPTPVDPVSGAAAGVPTAQARNSAGSRRMTVSMHQRNPHGAAATLLSALQRGRPAALCLPVFADPLTPRGPTNWDTPVGWSYGRILNPPPTSKVVGGHCVCVTGYAPDPAEPTGGFFVVRNSWSDQWGAANPSSQSRAPARGYGFVSGSYVNTYAWELFQI